MLDRIKSQFVTQWRNCGINFDDLDQFDQLEKMETKSRKVQIIKRTNLIDEHNIFQIQKRYTDLFI